MSKNIESCFAQAGLDKFNIRLPDGIREEIAQSAKRNERSMNSEIIHAIRTYLHHQTRIEAVEQALVREFDRLRSDVVQPLRKQG